jgi:hypothetical protein
VILFRDLFCRLLQSRRWIAAQFGLTLLLILIGLAWMRLPEKHVWQVLLSLLLPLLVAISALELQAGTMRSFANDDGKRVKLPWGAISLLFWIGVAWGCWAILNWCDDQIPQWTGYLNSQAPAHWRAKFLTYEHLSLWMSYIEWVLRWIVVPAKVIPFAIASAQCGWRLPVRRVLQLLWNWRWWLGVTIVALVSVCLPGHFYSATPHGAVSAQVWHVSLKLAASYLLAVSGWVLLIGWFAVLFGFQKPLPERDLLTELFELLRANGRWVGAQFGLVLLFTITNRAITHFLDSDSYLQSILSFVLGSVFYVGLLILQVKLLRSLLNDGGKHVRLIGGILAPLLWLIPLVVVYASLDSLHDAILRWLLFWIVPPAIFIPFVAASTIRGVRLPWRRVLSVARAWRWWLVALLAAIDVELALLISSNIFTAPTWVAEVSIGVVSLFVTGIWILLLGWFAVLFNRTSPVSDALAEKSEPISESE